MSVRILDLEIPTFLRTLLFGLLSPNCNGRGICIRTYVYLSMYKINLDSYVLTAPLGTVRKLECGIPTLSFSFVKKNWRAMFDSMCLHRYVDIVRFLANCVCPILVFCKPVNRTYG